MTDRSVFRVNYQNGDNLLSAHVCASSEAEAVAFLGVQDGSANIARLAAGIEVVGLDAAHDLIPPREVYKAPPQPEAQFSPGQLVALRKIMQEMLAKG
jgi:hypothetical protein